MTKYTYEQRQEARKILGIRDETGSIKLKDRDRESLLDTIDFITARHADKLTEMTAVIDALRKRLQDMRKAKRLANARADRAEKAMRAMLDAFAKEEDTNGA